MAQYAPAGHTRQSDADHDPSVGRYVPAAQGLQSDRWVAATDSEYVPEGQALQREADVDPGSGDHVPALQFWNDDPPGTAQYAPAGHFRQSDCDHDPLLDRYAPGAHAVGFTEPSLGQ